RDLEQGGLSHRLAWLAYEEQPLAVVGHDRDRSRVLDDLALGLLAVVVAEAVDADLGDTTLEGGLAVDALERHQATAAPAAAVPTIARVTSSMVSSASTVTASSGWWLRSVPFARFSTGRPAAMRALASLPPPV